MGVRDAKGKGFHVLAEDYASPSLDRLRARFKQVLPQAKWHVHEPLSSRNALEGATLAFGSPLIPRYQFEKASVILALGSDFLNTEDECGRHLRGWANGRRVTDGKSGEMNRLYVVENRFTVTGGMADHRLRLPASQIADYTLALAKAILGDQEFKSVTQALGGYSPVRDHGEWVKEVAKDLADTKNAGRVIVIAGREQPPVVHALAHAINARLGSHGSTITFQNAAATPPDGGIEELTKAMSAGDVETLLILFGLLGIAAGAFHWAGSGLYIDAKQAIATWLIDHGIVWPVEASAPWWILTNYADRNDVMTLLDGAVMIGYILALALGIGFFTGACVALATRLLGPWSWARFHHIVQSFIPLAGCGVFLGLSMTTVTLLRQEGLDLGLVGPLRAMMLAGASAWSLWLAYRIVSLQAAGVPRRILAMLPIALAVAASAAVWAALFWTI